MVSLVQYGKHGATNTSDTSTNGYYVIKFISEAYTLQNNTTIDAKIITTGEIVAKGKYTCYMQDSTNCYFEKHTQQKAIIFPTCKIRNPCIDAFGITPVQDIPKSVCNSFQEKNAYKYILFF